MHYSSLFNAPMQYPAILQYCVIKDLCAVHSVTLGVCTAVYSVTLGAVWDDVRPGGVIKLSLQVSIHLGG